MALQKGITIHQYLDDWSVRARSHQTCLQHTLILVAICQNLGWLVNTEKSELDPQTDLRLSWLPVQPEGGQGQIHSGALASCNCKHTRAADWTDLSGPASDVPDKVTDNHRKASLPLRETHIVAPK